MTFWEAFWRGVASVLDMGAVGHHHVVPTRRRGVSDAEALAGDWRNVGRDLGAAMGMTKRVKQHMADA